MRLQGDISAEIKNLLEKFDELKKLFSRCFPSDG
jgi:hypothetical protein